MAEIKPATLGGGRYRLQQRLGAGGMASVWLARDERLQRAVAVKLIADPLAGDDIWLRRFGREARAAAALSHRGVVPVFDYGVEDGRPFLVMEYISGGTLAQRLSESTPARPRAGSAVRPGRRGRGATPSPPDPVSLARELLDALAAVHAAGILHRDVKPANLLLDAGGHIRLTDFGIAQTRDTTSLTRTGMIVGTLRYIAPEVAAGEPASIASDLYAAGMVIREVAGESPPPALTALIEALTAEAPTDRPHSAADALGMLEAPRPPQRPGTAATAVQPRQPITAATTIVRSGRSSRVVLGGLALLAVLVVVIVAIASGGSGLSAPGVPAPAPKSAPIDRQVSALEQIVQSARRH